MKKITNIRPLLDGYKGHNYGLPDCMKFILEHLESDEKFDFWDIAAITGDSVAQVYNHNPSTGCEYCVSGYLAGSEHINYVFETLGYDHEYVTAEQFNADNKRYIQKIVEMIERDIPVLVKTNLNDIPEWHSDVGTYCLIVGYDHGGQIIKLLFEGTETVDCILTGENKMDLIFIGKNQREVVLKELYLKAVQKMVHWLTLPEHNGLFFGAAAFRAWANDIDAGRFCDDNLPLWENYGVYVCNLATSPAIPFFILKKISQMDSAFSSYIELYDDIRKLFPSFKPDDISPDESKDGLWSELEHIGGGMDMEIVKNTMQDKEKRSKVAMVLRNYAKRLDQTVELLKMFALE